jgi:sigma-B regulation protein RsbU (phosphoserine phosphatase)
MARLACYLAAMAAVLFALQKLMGLFARSWADHLGGWIGFLVFLSALLFFILAFRALRRKVLWRLRNRLIVTYVFIGVIPAVLLVGMALITLYGLAGQFAVFVVTSEIHSQLRSLESANAAVTNELAARLERGENPAAESLAGLRKRDPAWSRRQVCAWYGDKPLPLCNEFKGTSLTLPVFVKGRFRDIVRERDGLDLRVCSSLQLATNKLTVVTNEPFDKELVGNIANNLGEITLWASGLTFEPDPSNKDDKSGVPEKVRGGSTITSSSSKQGNTVQTRHGELHPTFSVGTLPEATGAFDREITFGTPLAVVNWNTGQQEKVGAVLQVTTRPTVLYGHLFAALGEFVQGVAYILMAVGAFFAIIELIALIIGTRMTRTVTAAVAQLHDATRHVDRGDFSHRIPVKSSDQLADLAISFNSMTASIEKLIQEQKEKQRLENELAIAQEVQNQLFPRRGRHQRKRNFRRIIDGDNPLRRPRLQHGKSFPDAGASRSGRGCRIRPNHGHVARGRRGFSRSPAQLAQPSALRKHSARKVRHTLSGNLRRTLASPHVQQWRTPASHLDRQGWRHPQARSGWHRRGPVRQHDLRRGRRRNASRRNLPGLQ